MLTVTFASNLGLYRTFIEAGLEDVYVTEGYEPFIDMLLDNGTIRINLFIEGVTARHLADKFPNVTDKIRTGIGRGQFEIGTYTYNHPVLSTIPYRDTFKQMEEGLKIDREIWGADPKGTMLPEAGWDPSLPRVLNDLGLEYLLMGKAEVRRDFPATKPDFFSRPFMVAGIDESLVTALSIDSTDWQEGEQAFYIEGGVIQGPEQNVKEFDDRVNQIRGDGDGAGQIMVCKNDGEFVYEGAAKAQYGIQGNRGGYYQHMGKSLGDEPRRRAEMMAKGWEIITARNDIQFQTISEYLANNKGQKTINLRPSFKQHREWLEGSEKLAAMLEETRSEIRCAEYTVKLARKLGRKTDRADELIRDAWMLLLEAEISTGRRACAHDAGKATRVYHSMELALEAMEMAQEAAEEM
ncbi:hypothetical protein ACFL4W_03655 [Planctomycetota bacterium]